MLFKELVFYHFQRTFLGVGGKLAFKYSLVGAFSICVAEMVPLQNTVKTGCNCPCDTGDG